MMTPIPVPAPYEGVLAQDERWALIVRIIGSGHFGRAVHLRELLSYLAKQAILSPTEDVSEQEIGWRVLGRRQHYDPQSDNIVRVQIRRLRQKLDDYFDAEGSGESLVASIPKGSHILRFEPRVLAVSHVVPESPVIATSNPWPHRLVLLIAFSLLGFLIGRASKSPVLPVTTPKASQVSPLWSRMFVKDKPTSIVIADSSIVMIQNILNKGFTLNEYIDRSYRDHIEKVGEPQLRDILRMIAGRQYTSLADATISGELRALGIQNDAQVEVRYSRHMNVRDFNTGNHILIGSSHGVPWVELFEPGLNFQFDRLGKEQRYGFRNRQPIQGELPVYLSHVPTTGTQENYATISMMPNLTHSGTVLMLNGVTMEATEASGEFAISPAFSAALLEHLGASNGQKLPYFQVLLKVASMAGAPHKVDVIAWRELGR